MVIKKSVERKNENIPYDFASYIFGVLSIVLSFLSDAGMGGIVLGIIGIVCAKQQKTALARKGKILSIIGLIIGLIVFAVAIGVMIYAIKTGLTNPLSNLG